MTGRVLYLATLWLALACGFFGVLVISTHLVTGILAIAVCATVLFPHRGRS